MSKIKATITFLFIINTSGFSQTLFIDSGQKLGESSSWSVSLQDLDGDNDLDACIDGQFWVNDGKANFTKSEKVIGSGSAVVFGDLNADGFIDAVCDSSIFINDGNWNFIKQKESFGKDVSGAWLLDLDNDNDLDAVAYTESSDQIWFNNGSGNFTNSGNSFGGWGQCKYETCDINADGYIDVIVAYPHTPPPSMNDNVNDKIWIGDGNGNFTEKVLESSNFQTRSAIPADFDSDGDQDLFMGKGFAIAGGSNWCKILFNDGSGNFTDSGQKLNSGYNSPDAKLADLDNDGDLDIFIVNGMPTDNGQPNTVWLNDGKGNFSDSGLRLGTSNSIAVALGDIDSDGDIDAVVANVNINTGKANTRVYLNTTNSPEDFGYLNEPPPGNSAVIFAKDIISKANIHGRLVVSPDGKELLWNHVDFSTNEVSIYRVVNKNGVWSPPEICSFASDGFTANPVFSLDGTRITFEFKADQNSNWTEKYVEKTGDVWGEPKDDESGLKGSASFTKNDKVYYTDYMANKPWERGIYCADYKNNSLSNIQALSSIINSQYIDYTPFISPDGDYLLFSSSRPSADENMYLYISFRNNDGTWSNPQKINSVIGFSGNARFPSISPDGKYLFFCGDDGNIYWVDIKTLERLRPTGIEKTGSLPAEFNLFQNYPNPFNPSTIIKYRLSKSCNIKLKIYNTLGQEIKTLVDSFQNVGEYSIVWNGRNSSGRDTPSGVYFYSLTSNDLSLLKKMTLIR